MMTKQNKSLERRIKRHLKAAEHPFFAVVRPGFEEEAAAEISRITGITELESEKGGIGFNGKLEQMWALHLRSFTLSSVRMRIDSFRAGTEGEAAAKIRSIPWELYLNPSTSPEVKVTLKSCRVPDGPLLGRIAEREISTTLAHFHKGQKGGTPVSRSAPPDQTEGQRIYLRGENNRFTLSLDCSGSRFYSRGYREAVSGAPLRETTAALILEAAEFRKFRKIIDPMCGSGTFSLEAAALSGGYAPGLERHFPFMEWPSFRPDSWKFLCAQIPFEKEQNNLKIQASDKEKKAGKSAAANVNKLKEKMEKSGLKSVPIEVTQKDFFDITRWKKETPGAESLILLNPPYGKRLESSENLYHRIGKILNGPLSEAAVAVISPGESTEAALKLRTDRKILFFNGGIRCALLIRYGAQTG